MLSHKLKARADMHNKESGQTKSLRRVVVSAILFGAVTTLILAVVVEVVLFIYPTLENYKREMDHEGDFATAIIGQDYMEDIFRRTKELYYSTPEEVRADQYSDAYTDICFTLVDEDFLKARDILQTCRIQARMDNVYFTFFDEENQRLVYVIDGNDREYAFLPGQWISNSNGTVDPPNVIERTLESAWYMPITFGKASGWDATDYSNVYDREGNVIGYMTINIGIDSFGRQISMFLSIYVPVMVVVLVVMVYMAVHGMNKRIIRPINSLAEAARKYMSISKVEKNVKTEVFKGLGIRTGDEIEELWDTMVDMEEDVSLAMEQIRTVTAKQERINVELNLARSIQAAALPTDFKGISKHSRFDIYASMTPAKEVGGDFYDFFMIDDDHLGMIIADVSGKGVPAALFMMVSKNLLKNTAKLGGKPSEMLRAVNDGLCEDGINDMFVTVWLGILTVSTGEVVASNAGHEYPFIADENGSYKLFKDPHGVVLGAIEGVKFVDYSFTLPKGGRIFVYTDGIAEAENEQEEFFGTNRIEECLNRTPGLTPEEQIKEMKRAVDEYAGKMEQFDDMTMLCLVYNG
jgi:sigma-B regulation protein RsbU (phosphoserine phosphatase)